MIERPAKHAWAAGVAAALVLAGCSIQIGGVRARAKPPTKPLTPTMEEIAAVRHLHFDNERVSHLLGIARRERLAAREQVYLVDVALDELNFDDGKSTVLIALIENAAFCEDAKVVILRKLDHINFESNRAAVLRAISDREEREAEETASSHS